jgi:hypothetical protein
MEENGSGLISGSISGFALTNWWQLQEPNQWKRRDLNPGPAEYEWKLLTASLTYPAPIQQRSRTRNPLRYQQARYLMLRIYRTYSFPRWQYPTSEVPKML